jgi:hypothetical protein
VFEYDGSEHPNHLAYAVRAFFEEGGRLLYVARVFRATDNEALAMPANDDTDDEWNTAGFATAAIADLNSPLNNPLRVP